MFDPHSPFALFDDNLAFEGDLLLDDLLESIVCTHPDELENFFAALERARKAGHWIALTARYELGYALEPYLAALLDRQREPLLTAQVFRRARQLAAETTDSTLQKALERLDEHERIAAIGGLEPGIQRATYCANVNRIRDWIATGDCYQVNYTFPLHGECAGHPLALYAALRERQPVRYGAYLQHENGVTLSRSPELFVERCGQRLTCRPMKGTAARETDPNALAASEKNRAENVMIVDLIRNDLGRLAPAGGVRVERLFDIEEFPSLWQMTSTVSASPIEADLFTIFRALFPCGSITGAPKIRSMQRIAALENAPRGVYCGALGWLAPDGNFRFSVPIRTLEINAERRFRCGLGSGIVTDSDAAQEWEECLLKGRFLSGLPTPFGLIETMRRAADGTYPLLDRHLARLTASAAYFRTPCDVDAIRAALLERPPSLRAPQRVRLELHPDGQFSITVASYLPQQEPVAIGISDTRVRSDNTLARHKTTVRSHFDAVLAEARAANLFDLICLNERSEIAEGARSSVFIDTGSGVLQTPPLTSGVLDGVMRRKLLESGRAQERVIHRITLESAQGIYVANALHGLLRAKLMLPA